MAVLSSDSRREFPLLAAIIGSAACALLFAMPAIPAENPPLEYAVKATYLYKFAPFVTWPPSTAQKATFDLCLSGNDDVTRLAPEAAAGQSINGKPLAVRVLTVGEGTDGCQILYIAASPAAVQMLDAVRNKPVLTITDATLPNHGIVEFKVVEHHVRFDIDNSLAAGAGLSISSKLLSLANAVTPVPGDVR
jgi:YfiR/HmsC-like